MNVQTTDMESTEPNFVAFRAAQQDYCVGIMDVREIRRWTETTTLPGAPDYVTGVINLRGAVVPIIDFSRRLGLETDAPSARNVIVIVQIGERICGLLVDEVSEILRISESHVQNTRSIGPSVEEAIVTGVIVLEERMIRLIDLERLFGTGQQGPAK